MNARRPQVWRGVCRWGRSSAGHVIVVCGLQEGVLARGAGDEPMAHRPSEIEHVSRRSSKVHRQAEGVSTCWHRPGSEFLLKALTGIGPYRRTE